MNYILGLKKYVHELSSFAESNNLKKSIIVTDGIWSWLRYGCVLNQFTDGCFYERKGFERKRILTYRRWEKLISTSNSKDYIHILQNKATFNTFYADYIGREWLDSKKMRIDDFARFMERHDGQAIVKPVADNEGHGVRLIKANKGNIADLFQKLSKEEVLIEERLHQHPLMRFGAKSVNTIRAYTVYDKRTGKAYLLKTTLRVGIGNAIVDNRHSGGISYEVNLESGRIVSKGWSHRLSNVMIHPGTDICMLGYEIPHWKEVIELVEKAARMLPQVRFIGWDVAIMPDRPVLIEGNHDPDLDLLEFVGSYGYYNQIMQHLS